MSDSTLADPPLRYDQLQAQTRAGVRLRLTVLRHFAALITPIIPMFDIVLAGSQAIDSPQQVALGILRQVRHRHIPPSTLLLALPVTTTYPRPRCCLPCPSPPHTPVHAVACLTRQRHIPPHLTQHHHIPPHLARHRLVESSPQRPPLLLCPWLAAIHILGSSNM